ncbi:tryptophan synthase beta subunit-like PLP-dependent enzyme [Xylariales sp. AK1849]|nr:tryptophan synthase beta subunit-like PLP-dependent enzyme [Xylariales sp. AK1849]
MAQILASLTRSSFHGAYTRISGKVHRTPVVTSTTLSKLIQESLPEHPFSSRERDLELFFKCENLQMGGSFKFRGTTHLLTRLADADLRRGIVTYSTGNHARALALAARAASDERRLPIPVAVVMSHNSAVSKLESLRQSGVDVFTTGDRPEDREAKAVEIQERTGALLIPPSDSPEIALGQGSAILEFMQQVKELAEGELDAVIMPSGGGGLLTGASLICKGTGVRVYGSEPQEGGPCLVQGRETGSRVERIKTSTIADGLRVPVGRTYFELLRKSEYVNGVYTATEDQIRRAMRVALTELKVVVEPSAAVALAVVLYNRDFHQCLARDQSLKKIGIVLTGGNVSVDVLLQVISSQGNTCD